MRRQHYTIDYSAARPTAGVPASALPKSIDLLIEYYDFGTPVAVTIPPPSEVQDIASLFPGAATSSGGAADASGSVDAAAAAKQVLTGADYPAGWTTAPHAKDPANAALNKEFFGCLGLGDPATIQTADVDGPDATSGSLSSQSNGTYTKTQQQADAELAAFKGPRSAGCVKAELTKALSAGGYAPSSITVGPLAVSTPGIPSVGFHVTVTTSTATIFVDAVQLFAHGAQPNLTLVSQGTPFPAATERAIIATLAAKAKAA